MGKENMVSEAAVVGFSNEDIGIESADKSKRLEVKRASRLAVFCNDNRLLRTALDSVISDI